MLCNSYIINLSALDQVFFYMTVEQVVCFSSKMTWELYKWINFRTFRDKFNSHENKNIETYTIQVCIYGTKSLKTVKKKNLKNG